MRGKDAERGEGERLGRRLSTKRGEEPLALRRCASSTSPSQSAPNTMAAPRKIVVLVSGSGECLRPA